MSTSPFSRERTPRAGRGDLAIDDPPQLGQRAGFPVVEADEDGLLAGRPGFDLEGAAAAIVARHPVEGPGILVGRVFLGQFRIDDDRHRDREVRHGQLVVSIQGEFERVIVDDRELLGLDHAARGHLHGGKAAGRHGAVERPFDVLGGHRRAVVEGRVLAQVEDIGLAVVGRFPALGEFRRDRVLVVGPGPIRQGLLAVADEPIISLPVDHAAVIVGRGNHRVEPVRPLFGDHDQRVLR